MVKPIRKSKRINWSKLSKDDAKRMIGESHGMTKAKWERLWRVAYG
jgi:hypothetical protein